MKKTWKTYMGFLLALILSMGMMTGCGGGPEDVQEEQLPDYPVKLYYVSSEYLETGDESIEPMIMTEVLVPTDGEMSDFYDIYDIALDILTEVMGEGMDTMVKVEMVNDTTVTDGVAVVDFNGEAMHGGSMEEVYLIEQVVRTLVKSFDEITTVQFTVDGQTVDSLMGHLEANCSYGLISVEEDGIDVELVTIMEE
ncbi:MAG: GerMN domain-containing protein [Firmicutes bacterium]|nr:GerMN domain-containing protein [Bacillota bacterium]